MDTLHKLAGVTEATDANDQPSQPIPETLHVPQETTNDPNDGQTISHRASRASLPLNRQPSHKSFRSSRKDAVISGDDNHPPLPSPHISSRRPSHTSAGTGVTGSDEEFAWGPSHPCFPHPNAHCAPDSDEARTTRVIRVQRDWLQAGDLYPQFANLYPEILDPLVTDDEFRFLVSNLNTRVKAAFDPYSTRAWLDAALGIATGFIWDDLGLTGSKQGVKSLEAFVERWNAEKKQEGRDVRLVQLRTTGFMALDFVVPDPGIDAVPEGEGGIGPAQ